jgi:DNA primase
MRLPETFLQQLKERAEIESLAAPMVQLRRMGRTLRGLCPFHNEKTPSFYIYPESNSFYCFGCGAGGDVVTFAMKSENLDYMDAVRYLCDRTGLQLPQGDYDDGLAALRGRILSANRAAARWFHDQLKTEQGKIGLDYWKSRRITQQTITHFGLGFAPPGWDNLLKALQTQGFTAEELVAANLAAQGEKNGRRYTYDVFRDRVMVPIFDIRGNVVAFGGRVLDDSKPKYINTSDTLAYKKGNAVFALQRAKNQPDKRFILCEGYMDAISLHQAGFPQTVAGLGTALTQEQAKSLSRYADEIVLCYDADEAGQKATKRALEILGNTTLKLRVLRLSGGKDPDEILRTWGSEKFRGLLEGAANEIEFRLLEARGKIDLSLPDGKLAYLRSAAKILAGQDPAARGIYASRLAEELEVSKETITTQVELLARQAKKVRERQIAYEIPPIQPELVRRVDSVRGQFPGAEKAEETLLGLLQLNAELYPKLQKQLQADLFMTPFNDTLLQILLKELEQEHEIDLTFLSGDLTEIQLSELQRMRISANTTQSPPFETCMSCIARLQQEKQKLQIAHIDVMDTDLFQNQIATLQKTAGGIS